MVASDKDFVTGSEALSGRFPHLPPIRYLRAVPQPKPPEYSSRNHNPDSRTLEREAQLIGAHFGVLTILRRLDTRNKARWICKCQCGNPETRPKRLEDLFAKPASCGFLCPFYRSARGYPMALRVQK